MARPSAVVAEPSLASTPAPVRVASAGPSPIETKTAAPKPVVSELTPISHDQPPFPREALSAGVSKGSVRARIVVDAAGKVSSVSILEASPRRVFDRVVTNTLAQWTFNPGAAGRSTDVDITFTRD
ncbi:MAG: TonB family protein [Proteobacteria bacterium]|nr:TonB family protein [Pseudomonadota bacterium]